MTSVLSERQSSEAATQRVGNDTAKPRGTSFLKDYQLYVAVILLAIAGGATIVFVHDGSEVVILGVILVLGLWMSSHPLSPPTDAGTKPSGMLSILIVMAFGYQILFNYLPARLSDASIVGSLLILAACVLLLRPGAIENTIGLFAALGLFVATVAASLFLVGNHLDILATFRFLVPFIVACAVIRSPQFVSPRALGLCAIAMSVAALIIGLKGGIEVVSDVPRLTPFTGGADNAHSSAYDLVVAMMILNESRLRRTFPTLILWSALATDGVLLLLLRVSTAELMIAVYLVVRLWERHRSLLGRLAICGVLMVALAGFYGLREAEIRDHIYAPQTTGANEFSSGRLSVWGQRLDILDSRSIPLFLVGSGVGSDLSVSPTWGDILEDSHNDLLTLLIEDGVIGTLAVVAGFGALARLSGRRGRALLVAFVAASLVSNALLARPMIATLFWFAVVLTMIPLSPPGDAPSGRSADILPTI